MSEIKTFKRKLYKVTYGNRILIIKSKKRLWRSPKRSYLWLQRVLNKSAKSIKKVLQELKSARKSPLAENPHHAETSQSTRNADKLTCCNKTQGQNQKRPQNRLEYHKYLLFLNIN